MTSTIAPLVESAFPSLDDLERKIIRGFAREEHFASGDYLFRAGDVEADLFVVVKGVIEIRNPVDDDHVLAIHHEHEFTGDIDILTGRPVVVAAVARGDVVVLRVPSARIRDLLQSIPSMGEKLIIAFTRRREMLSKSAKSGLQVIGPIECKETLLLREFLYKSFVPFNWVDSESEHGQELLATYESELRKTPAVICADGTRLTTPSLRQLAQCARVWKPCTDQSVDLAIIGAGPAGLATAVYAASEGISTILLDRMGPGGQAAGSSKIENFIGFPAGLSGAELAMRGVIQMLKFGARMAAPLLVESIEPSANSDSPIIIRADSGLTIQARVALIATGVCWRRLEVPNAMRFEGIAVHYLCTAVEAHVYDNQDVAVVGGGNSAGQAAMFLAECCRTRTVHLIIRSHMDEGMSKYLQNRIRRTANIVVYERSEVVAFEGEEHFEALQLKNLDTSQLRSLKCRGAFIFIGALPATDFLPGSIARDDRGYILTGLDVMRSKRWPLQNRDPCALETTLPRVLAAGDVRAGATKRVGFAVGDGSLAVSCTHQLLTQ